MQWGPRGRIGWCFRGSFVCEVVGALRNWLAHCGIPPDRIGWCIRELVGAVGNLLGGLDGALGNWLVH